ncbi:hypothetical protein LCGC14_1239510 [marine sediment metagenome]|uniref:Uncharacterized protein n=1 Tax=marine sediment metagenome TaxID=412755 RepID=A0A0F9LTG7_9ZZZZ
MSETGSVGLPTTPGAAARARNEQIIEVSTGRLTGLAVIVDADGISSSQIFAICGTQDNGIGRNHITNILTQGYLGSESMLGWEGDILLSETETIFLWTYQNTAATLKVEARIEAG